MRSDLVPDPSPTPDQLVAESEEGFSEAEVEAYVATLRVLCALPPRVGLAIWRALCAFPRLPAAHHQGDTDAIAAFAPAPLRAVPLSQ